jgi:hypothetical protein
MRGFGFSELEQGRIGRPVSPRSTEGTRKLFAGLYVPLKLQSTSRFGHFGVSVDSHVSAESYTSWMYEFRYNLIYLVCFCINSPRTHGPIIHTRLCRSS